MAGRFGVRKIRTSLWFVPVVCVLAGVVLSFATIAVDRLTDYELIPRTLTGGPDAAIAILSTIGASMVSLAALVLTITMVVVQLAMGQFSPRIVQTFLQDRPSQLAIGLFVATFAHAMLALREVSFDPERVPGLAIVVGYVLVVLSIVVLVAYVHHIGRSLRVSALIELVGSDTRRLLDEQYPDSSNDAGSDAGPDVIVAEVSGVVCLIDRERLVDLARDAGCTLRMVPALGEFVPAGATLFEVDGDPTGLDRKEVIGALHFGLERSLGQDVAYGFRLLVDIAERSVSESPFLDPTTAVQAIDRLHDCLRQLARRPFPDGHHHDEDGELRLVIPVMDWDAYVRLAFEEIRLAGAASPQVVRRLRSALDDLIRLAPEDRRPVLEEEVRLLRAAAEAAAGPGSTIDLTADTQGIGVRAGSDPVARP